MNIFITYADILLRRKECEGIGIEIKIYLYKNHELFIGQNLFLVISF